MSKDNLKFVDAIHLLQPQLGNHFNLNITFKGKMAESDNDILGLALQTAALPNITIEEVEVPYRGGKAHYAGGVTYETLSATFMDYLDKNVAKTLIKWHNLVFDLQKMTGGYAKDYKMDAELLVYDPAYKNPRAWILKGIFPTILNYGTLDFSSNEPVKIEGTFRYDFAYPDKSLL
jgi:hypothetical protein